jgi:predicted dienelactone hydrolase
MIKKSAKLLVGVFIVLIIIAVLGHSVIIPKLIPLSDLPTPSGVYSVGTKIFEWTDESRDEWFTEDKDDKRRIVVQVWYPSEDTNSAPVPYLVSADKWLPALSDILEIPQFLFDHLRDIGTHSVLNAPVNKKVENTPLVLFSHGIWGMRFQNTAQFEALASRGYIVVSVDHAYDASLTLFKDGTIADFRSGYEGELSEEEFWALRNPQLQTRVSDIRFMIDTIGVKQLKGGELWSVVDMERIGVFGHSYGGATSLIASVQDERIDAAIALDGWMIPIPLDVIDRGSDKPFYYIGRESWADPLNYQQLNKFLKRSSNQSTLFLTGTKHFDFSDTPLFSPYMQTFGLSGVIPAEELAKKLENEIVGFFDNHLNHESEI